MSSLYPIVVAAPIIGLAVYCIAQIAVARMATGGSPYHSLAVGFLVGLLSVVVVAAWTVSLMAVSVQDRVGYVVLDLLTYLALAFGYFNFVNLTVASLRIRLLEELAQCGGIMQREQLIERHSSENVVAIRLGRLIRGGHLIERNGRLFSGRMAFLFIARIFDALRWGIIGRNKPGK